MKKLDITIDNPTGLHARPAKYFVQVAKKFKSDIRLLRDGKKANAKSLVSILTLGVKCGHEIQIVVEGVDEDQALDALKAAIDDNLGEDQSQKSACPAPVQPSEENAVPIQVDSRSTAHVIQGISGAPGVVIAPVRQLKRSQIQIEETFAGASVEQTRLQEAIEEARGQLTALKNKMTQYSAEEADIFDAHLELLEDPELLEQVLAKLETEQSAAQAWQTTIEARAKAISELDDPLLAAREADLHDVSYRVLRCLVGAEDQHLDDVDQPVVIIAHDLSPSETATLDKKKVCGFCTAAGGPTAHSAIIARAMGIPAVVSAGPEVLEIANQTLVIVNGDDGAIVVDPDESKRSHAEGAVKRSQRQRKAAEKLAAKPAITKDGHRVEIAANIGGLEEARKAAESGAEGVGLLRTEFLFLEREQEPTEQEQFEVYRDIVQALRGKPVILRTLDIGGDKPLPYMPMASEQNPFLGERGIRLCINKPELLTNQLRAILRSAAFGPLRIMLPMVTDLSEFEKIRTIVESVRSELSAPEVELGVMIEVPSAALTAGALAAVVDFFSIGTNDLTQYTLAIDRMHSKLAYRLDGLHPAVLCLIDRVVQAAEKYGKWVGVCGELASDMQAIPLLVGLGVHELSVTVPAVAGVKAKVRSLSLRQAQDLAQKALQCATADQVRELSPKT